MSFGGGLKRFSVGDFAAENPRVAGQGEFVFGILYRAVIVTRGHGDADDNFDREQALAGVAFDVSGSDAGRKIEGTHRAPRTVETRCLSSQASRSDFL